ncbi:MAG: TolC family protein [Candidatus Latescibacteria bacterium]|nr:TolC family protein [Candidatus Latescibacterota bacterium]
MSNKLLGIVVFLLISLFPHAGMAQTDKFLNLTMERAISISLENNREISNAQEERIKADFQITEAASAAFPQINGNWNYERNLKPMVFVISFPDSDGVLQKNRLKVGTDNTMNLGATLTQPIYVGGKVGTALKAAKIYKNISEKTLLTVKQNVVAGVVQAFNSVLLAEEMLSINRESLAQAEKHLNNVKTLHDAGSATEYDLLRARVQVSNMKPDLLAAENQVTVAQLKLKEVMGVSPDDPLSVSGSFSEPDTTLFAIASFETALESRPDLKVSEYSVDLYDKAINIAKGDFLPTLTAGSTFAYAGNFDIFRYEAEDWNRYWTASVTLSFPIFSGLKNYSKYKQAKTDYYKAKTDYKKTHDAVLIEVQESVLNLRKAVKTIESQRMNVEEAGKALEMAESLYKNGKATQLEVLDAQLALEVARTNMVAALYEGTIAEIMLKRNLGILDTDS